MKVSKDFFFFLGQDPKNTNYKWSFIEFKPTLLKDTVKKLERQATDKEKIFTTLTSDTGPISRIYKELLHLTAQ